MFLFPISDGLKDVIVYTSSDDKSLNRGFAFLEYEDHKAAFTARKKLMSGRVQVFGGVNISVDWADPIIEPDEETMSKVKVVYIRNLTPAATEEKIKEKFSEFGELEKVKKIKDYCFVHYKERESAEKVSLISCYLLIDTLSSIFNQISNKAISVYQLITNIAECEHCITPHKTIFFKHS